MLKSFPVYKMKNSAFASAVLGLAALAAAQTTTYQAEDATLNGVTVGRSVAGYTGNIS